MPVTDFPPSDEPNPPPLFRETLAHFNYGDPAERERAIEFRNAEFPFKLYNVSELDDVSNLWTDEYLTRQIKGKDSYHVEQSDTNHFMYWNGNFFNLRHFEPPTTIIHDMNFKKWLRLAKAADENAISNSSTHFYFMTNALAGEAGRRSFIAQDLKFFSTRRPNFFITNVAANKGIQCRFGMRGVIAESHYDSGRNMIAMIKGDKSRRCHGICGSSDS